VLENHERIHFAQQRELILVGFYLLYVWDYFVGRLAGMDHHEAYREIRFEREAFDNEAHLGYLTDRRRFAFTDYA
jgi:hypothetical protein